jgi:hypothetical protein
MTDILFTPIRLRELEILLENSVRKVLEENHSTPSAKPTDRTLRTQNSKRKHKQKGASDSRRKKMVLNTKKG